jgi:hypothetical protein
MEVHIECEEHRVAARAAVMVLEGLTLFREAVAIENDSDVAELLQRIERGRGDRGSASVGRVLATAGERFMRGDLPVLLGDDLLVLDGLLSAVAPVDDVELESLTAGTLTGVFRELIRWLAERLATAVRTSSALLPVNRTPNLTSFQALLPEAGGPRQIASGLFAFGASRFRTGYTMLGATAVRVRGDDRHSGSGVPFNPVFGGGPHRPIDLPRPGANA